METSDMKKSKSEMLKSFIKTIHQGRDELLTKFLVSFNTKASFHISTILGLNFSYYFRTVFRIGMLLGTECWPK